MSSSAEPSDPGVDPRLHDEDDAEFASLGPHPSSLESAKREWCKRKFQTEADVADPRRYYLRVSNHEYEGIGVLRVLLDTRAESDGKACSTSGAYPEWVASQIRKFDEERATRTPRRVAGVVFDTVLPGMPTVRQQFDMIRLYCEANSSRLAWDGWEDTCVQFLEPDGKRMSFRYLNVSDHLFWHLHDHNHIVLPTICFLGRPPDYGILPLAAACRDKTLAILDHGIDTLRFPHQLAVAGNYIRGTVTTPFLSTIGGKLNKSFKAVAWKIAGGRVIASKKLRQKIEMAVQAIDEGICYSENKEAFARLLQSLWPKFSIFAPARQTATISTYYVAHKLGYPSVLTRQIAKAIIEYGKMDVATYGPKVFDEERAREIMGDLATQSGKAWKLMLAINADKDARRLFKRAIQQYKPPTMDAWVIDALAMSPPREVRDPRDSMTRLGKRIIRELRAEITSLGENDESLMAGYVRYVARRLHEIERSIKIKEGRRKIRDLPITAGPQMTLHEDGSVTIQQGGRIARRFRENQKLRRRILLSKGIVLHNLDDPLDNVEYAFPAQDDKRFSVDKQLRGIDGPHLPGAWAGDDDPALL